MKVFLSSTFLDLKEHRERVSEAIQRLGDEASRMEIFGARPEAPTRACLQEVQECDLFVGIYAHHYGYIPEGSSISITEMEYDEACRSKPRFCYLVREDYSWPKTYIDQGEAKSKLEQFRAKLQRETVRDTFTTPEDLAFKVASALGRHLRRAIVPAPPIWDELVKRWTDEEANARATYRLQVLESREPLVQLAVVKDLWTKLLFNPPWHEEVESDIALLKADVEGDESLETLCKDLFALDTRADYPQLCDGLAQTLPANLEKILNPQIQRLERESSRQEEGQARESGDSPLSHELNRLKRIRAKLRSLGEMARTPQFGRCLLIAGGTGSGKSHVLNYLDPDLRPAPADAGAAPVMLAGPRSFLLRLRPTEDPSGQILRRVREISGYPWQSLEQVDQYFTDIGRDLHAKARPRLILLIDDLHRWICGRESHLQELETWIARSTHLACLRWVIALPATSYSEIAGSEHFWRAFSILSENESGTRRRSEVARSTGRQHLETIRQVGGWLWLDESNQSERLGQQLIRKYIDRYRPEESTLLNYLDQDSSTSPDEGEHESGSWRRQNRYLNTPQIAWVLLDFLGEEEAQALVNLHFIGFVERFSRKRWVALRRESTPGRTPDEDQIRMVARVLLEECIPFAKRAKTISAIVRQAGQGGDSVLEDAGRASDVLYLLAKAGLLETFEDSSPDPGRVALQVPFFWYYQVASSIFEAHLAETECLEKEIWIAKVADRDAREGISEFLLLFADREFGGARDGVRRMESLWHQATGNPALPDAARWLAASKASLCLQGVATRWIQEKGWLPEDPREVFAFLVFLGEVDPSVFPPSACLALLQRMVGSVDSAKLQEYYVLVVTKVFDRISSQEEWLRGAPYLAGCEALGVTSTLGRLAADTAVRICDGDSGAALQLLLRYLPTEPARDKPPHEGEGANRVLAREWIVFHVLDRVHYLYEDRSLGPSDLLAKLQTVSWYRPERLRIVPQVVGEMERDANSVLGFFYRTQREEKQKLYEEALRALAYSSNVRDRRLAFFLILHTESTGGKEEVVIQETFGPLLKKIFVDREHAIQRVVDDYYPVFSKSLPEAEFEEIRRQRPRRRK